MAYAVEKWWMPVMVARNFGKGREIKRELRVLCLGGCGCRILLFFFDKTKIYEKTNMPLYLTDQATGQLELPNHVSPCV